jgi:hypothetical protein
MSPRRDMCGRPRLQRQHSGEFSHLDARRSCSRDGVCALAWRSRHAARPHRADP